MRAITSQGMPKAWLIAAIDQVAMEAKPAVA
jgi:hypothetical protein